MKQKPLIMTDPIICYEHELLEWDKIPQKEAQDWLKKLSNETDKTHKIGLRITGKGVKFSQYAGYLQSPDGTQIMVLPKTHKNQDPVKAQNLLYKMITALIDPQHKDINQRVNLDNQSKFTPLEWIFQVFLQNLGDLIKKSGLQGQYNSVQENLSTMKGRVLWGQNIAQNHSNQARFACEYDEFSFDSPINRLIKTATMLCLRHAKTADNQRLARQYNFYLDEVPNCADKAHITRDLHLIQYKPPPKKYDKIIPWCRLILNNMPFNNFANTQSIILMFEMNKLFEALVRQYLQNQGLNPLQPKKNLISNQNDEKFLLKPDFYFENYNNNIIIADAKWKTLNANANDGKFGVSQGDLYQIYTYIGVFDATKAILIYPETDSFKDAFSWQFTNPKKEIIIAPFDCENLEKNLCLCDYIKNG